MTKRFAPDLSKQEREDLEVAGMSPRAIDDAIATLRLASTKPFTLQAVLAMGPLRREEKAVQQSSKTERMPHGLEVAGLKS